MGKYSVILRVQKQIEQYFTVLIFILKTLGNLSRFPKYQNDDSIIMSFFIYGFILVMARWNFELKIWIEFEKQNFCPNALYPLP
mgnify:CR=1 FL=1